MKLATLRTSDGHRAARIDEAAGTATLLGASEVVARTGETFEAAFARIRPAATAAIGVMKCSGAKGRQAARMRRATGPRNSCPTGRRSVGP